MCSQCECGHSLGEHPRAVCFSSTQLGSMYPCRVCDCINYLSRPEGTEDGDVAVPETPNRESAGQKTGIGEKNGRKQREE